MQVRREKTSKIWVNSGLAVVLLAVILLPAPQVWAMVKGRCDTCHTMHNSQNDTSMVHVDDGTFTYAGWNASNILDGGAILENEIPREQLLVSDCVGCHSSTGTSALVTDANSNNIPIVFNTNGYPVDALAGGNFFGVTGGNDGNGHNVRGIVGVDSDITILEGAPGGVGAGCAQSCHVSLALADGIVASHSDPQYRVNGCKGCHLKVGHHNPTDTSYRFLGGHDDSLGIIVVAGGEDDDWEHTKSDTDHNIYYWQDPAQLEADQKELAPIGLFCAGCHLKFHASGEANLNWGIDNGGDPNTDGKITINSPTVSPWMRHPTNVNIPNDGEYAQLFAAGGAAYDPLVPVAQNPAGSTDVISAGDQVFCLSCHRAHASDRADALRFDYNSLTAHNMVSDSTVGCFYCHRTKDL